MLLLAGRIALERGDIDKARLHMHQAQEAGMDPAKVLPFRAEIAFETGNYAEIPGLLSSLPPQMQQRPPFAGLIRTWT